MTSWIQGLGYMLRFVGRRKGRSALILLSVAWGTLSMMLLLGFGEGLKLQMQKGSMGLGTSPLIMWPGSTTRAWEGMKPGRPIRFVEEDLVALSRAVPEIDQIAAENVQWSVDLRWGAHSVSTRVTGVMPCYETVRSHHPQPGGRFLNNVDQASSRRVIFIGPALKERLFGASECIGQTVFLSGVPMTVVGVMVDKQQMGMYGGPDVEKASIPLSTFEALYRQEAVQQCPVHPQGRFEPGSGREVRTRGARAPLPLRSGGRERGPHLERREEQRRGQRRSSRGSRRSWAWSAR